MAGIEIDGTHEAENRKCIIDADTRPEGWTEAQDTGKNVPSSHAPFLQI